MSSVPTNKEELYQAIKLNSEKILEDYLSIPKEYAHKNDIEGNVKGAIINVADTLAYLIGWGQLVLKWHQLKSEGSDVDFPETGYKWNELGQLAQCFQSQFKSWSYSHLILEFKVTIAKILSLIESLDNHSLYDIAWYEKYTLGKMIQLNTSSPMKNMRIKVRRFKKINQI
jgi:hypothetical protein